MEFAVGNEWVSPSRLVVWRKLLLLAHGLSDTVQVSVIKCIEITSL